MEIAYLSTHLGTVQIEGDHTGIKRIFATDAPCPGDHVPENLQDAVIQIGEYFEGKREVFDLNLTPEGSDFQKRVWNLLLEIPYGKTVSYLDLAHRYGNKKSVRAIAAANAKNPIWIVIPCHRVIGSNGSLTGYAGGLQRKKWLLEHEQDAVQQTLNI